MLGWFSFFLGLVFLLVGSLTGAKGGGLAFRRGIGPEGPEDVGTAQQGMFGSCAGGTTTKLQNWGRA